MYRYCSDCRNLKTSDKKEDGVYKCPKKEKKDKKKAYTYAHTPACEDFSMSYARSSTEKERLFDMGKNAMKNKKPDPTLNKYPYILIFLAILAQLYFTFFQK